MVSVFRFSLAHVHKFDVEHCCVFKDAFVTIKLTKHDAFDACVCNHLETVPARRRRDINAGAFDANAMHGSLNHCVGFRVNGAHTMPIHHHVSDIIAMGQTADRAIVTCGQHAPVTHNDCAHVFSVACGSCGHRLCDVHEVMIPRWFFCGCVSRRCWWCWRFL